MMFRVDIIESERGWGQKKDGEYFFETIEEADKFVAKYNSQNTEKEVPDYYTYAMEPVIDRTKKCEPKPSSFTTTNLLAELRSDRL